MPNFHDSETVVSPAEIKIGQFIANRYRIVKLLGGGGFGAVYLTEDTNLNQRHTVIKFLNREMLADAAVRMKFDDEKTALIRLSARRHPSIGDIYDSGVLPDGTPFIAMQFIPGIPLRERMIDRFKAGQSLSIPEIAAILEQLGDALAAAHESGIIHRDIKPDNVMLIPQPDGSDRVVLIDFGIARISGVHGNDPNRPATGGMGTLRYAAPEQFMTNHELTSACDVYAFSAMAFELLTGWPPFPECGLDQFLTQRQTGPTERATILRPGLPATVDALLFAGLTYTPARRPQDIRVFSRQLAEGLRNATGSTPRVDPDARTVAEFPRETDPNRGGQNLHQTLPATDPKAASDAHVEGLKAELEQNRPTQRKIPLLAILTVAIFAGGGILAWRFLPTTPPSKPIPASTASPSRGFTFAVQVQKMRDGKAYQDPYWGNGREVFENGYKFLLEITPDAKGDLYVFADGKNESGASEINILFPTPKRNDGSSSVTAGQTIQTGQNTFTGATGNEVLYIVWTSGKQNVLDAARKECFENGGTLKAGKIETDLRNFLSTAKADEPKIDFVEDEKRPFGTVQGKGEAVVYRVELKHR